jgi:hypothetical protein
MIVRGEWVIKALQAVGRRLYLNASLPCPVERVCRLPCRSPKWQYGPTLLAGAGPVASGTTFTRMDEIHRLSRPDVPARSIFRTGLDARRLDRYCMTVRVPVRRRMAVWRQGIVVTNGPGHAGGAIGVPPTAWGARRPGPRPPIAACAV